MSSDGKRTSADHRAISVAAFAFEYKNLFHLSSENFAVVLIAKLTVR